MLENVSEDEIDEISEDLRCTPPEIREAVKEASFDLLPAKSKACTNGTSGQITPRFVTKFVQ